MAAKKRKEAMEQEIEKVKMEYEEKTKRRKEKKSKDGKKDKEKEKDKAGKDEDEAKAEKEKNDKVRVFYRPEMKMKMKIDANSTLARSKRLQTIVLPLLRGTYLESTPCKSTQNSSKVSFIPYQLMEYRIFYQKRLDRIRNAEAARRNRERLKNPTTFPSVPSKDLG